MNFQMFNLVLEKAEEKRKRQRSNCRHPLDHEKGRPFQKNIYFCFIDYAKAFDCVNHNKLWKILKEMGIPDHLTCFLRNLYAGQETTVRTVGTTDWFQIGKGVHQGCRVHHEKCWTGRNTSWNQDCREKYQSPQISR